MCIGDIQAHGSLSVSKKADFMQTHVHHSCITLPEHLHLFGNFTLILIFLLCQKGSGKSELERAREEVHSFWPTGQMWPAEP